MHYLSKLTATVSIALALTGMASMSCHAAAGGVDMGERELTGESADKALKLIAARFNDHPVLQAKLECETEDLLGPRKENGDLLVSRPQKMMRRFPGPPLKYWLLDGGCVKEYSGAQNTLSVKDFTNSPEKLKLARCAMTLDVEALKKKFTFHVFVNGKEDGSGACRVLLEAIAEGDKAPPYKSIQGKVDAGGVFWREIEYVPDSGDKITERYSSIEEVKELKPEVFAPELPAGVKTETMRVD